MISAAEQRFPVGIRIAVPPNGLGPQGEIVNPADRA
jgi:hypothetical protein